MKDLTQRLENIEKESQKVAITKSFTTFIVIDVTILILLMIFPYLGIAPISASSSLVLILIAFFLNICGICSLYTIYKDNETSKRNATLVNSLLSSVHYKEVIPKTVTPEYYEFLTEELPKLATFYAILDDMTQKVEIDLHFINDDNYCRLTYVDKANFLSMYTLK